MWKSYQRTGVVSKSELKNKGLVPPTERLKKGPVVMVECIENIPCDPCSYACPREAITIEGGLTAIPKVEFSKCNGCGVCVARCPGLAIFVVNWAYSAKEATVTLPYELIPIPEVGAVVSGLDRSGKKVCTARVVKVAAMPPAGGGVASKVHHYRCAMVTIAVPKRFWNDVRAIRLNRKV